MHREEEGTGHRHARLERLIFEELRALLRDDVSDPALGSAEITAVLLSPDYRHARVHFALHDPTAKQAAARAFVRATPFLRARLADAVDLKRVPDLRFVFDAAIAGAIGGATLE